MGILTSRAYIGETSVGCQMEMVFPQVASATLVSQTVPEQSQTECCAGPQSTLLPAQSSELGV